MAWCDQCHTEKPGWIPVKRKLPAIDRIVMVAYPSGFDGSPIYAWGARIDDGDGWCWGVRTGYCSGIHPTETANWNGIEVDDDYKVTHWAPLLRAPFRKPRKA